MAAIEIVSRPVYKAPTKRRCYLTPKSAANAEASAMLVKKYPTERTEYEESGRITYGGWHWNSDERLVKVHDRLTRRILRQLRGKATP